MAKYMRNDLLDEYGIVDLQDKILEIMIYVDKLCAEHSVDYCLMAGSALGAQRHKGFIPWDDDIDIYMTEDDYQRFRDVFEKYADKDLFYLQEWGKTEYKGKSMITMAKVRMNNTEIKEKAYLGWNIHQGVFVDIFIIHNCPESLFQQKIQYLWTEAVVLKGLALRGYKPKGFVDFTLLSVIKMIPTKWLLKHGLYNSYRFQGKKTKYMSGFIDTIQFSRAVFVRNDIFPTRYENFETVKVRVPANNDKYLAIRFGQNYMELPDESKRQVSKHAIGWSFEREEPYDYSDEYKLV